jgi:CubicO group peptidase (beta-lactamase class C family)
VFAGEMLEALAPCFQDRADPALVPAASAAVIEHGELIVGAWGAEPDTLFQAASVSKPVTAFAVMRLVASGRLDLDADVNDLLSSWQLEASGGRSAHVTVRQLLSHSAAVNVPGFPGYRPGGPMPSLSAILDGLPPANTPPVRVEGIPGLASTYSGGGFVILQQVLEDQLGRPFSEIVDELVFEPAGMTTATFEQREGNGPERRAVGHVGGRPLQEGWNLYPEAAAAGMWCSAADLVRLADAVQSSLAGEASALLPSGIAKQMVTPVFSGVGLGFGLRGTGSHRRFAHTGGNLGFRCEVCGTIGSRRCAAVMTNGDEGDVVAGAMMAKAATVANWPDLDGRPMFYELSRPSVLHFETSAGVPVTLQLSEDATMLRVGPWQPAWSLMMVTDRSAEPDGMASVRVIFDIDDTGALTGLIIEQQNTAVFARWIGASHKDS